MRWCGICNLAEFSDPEYLDEARRIFCRDAARDSSWPKGVEHRKDWEYTKTAMAFRVFGALRPDAMLLNVAGAHDPLNYYLTNYVRWVFSTDLYGEGVWAAQGTAELNVLRDTGAYFWDHRMSSWNPRRLVMQHMDARELRYEDATFDGVWSLSSIEHMDGLAGAITATREMARVTKPGAPIVIVTECVVDGSNPFYAPDVSIFSPEQVQEIIDAVGDVAELVEPLSYADLDRDPTFVHDHAHEIEKIRAGYEESLPAILYSTARTWPGTGTFTSVFLVFRRRLAPTPLADAPPATMASATASLPNGVPKIWTSGTA